MEVVICISALLIIVLILVIRGLNNELREAKIALNERERRLKNFERSAFCALHNVEEAKRGLSVIESGVDVKSNEKGFQACVAYRTLNVYLTRAISSLTPIAYYKAHF